jgi:hypothetical protein
MGRSAAAEAALARRRRRRTENIERRAIIIGLDLEFKQREKERK